MDELPPERRKKIEKMTQEELEKIKKDKSKENE